MALSVTCADHLMEVDQHAEDAGATTAKAVLARAAVKRCRQGARSFAVADFMQSDILIGDDATDEGLNNSSRLSRLRLHSSAALSSHRLMPALQARPSPVSIRVSEYTRHH